MVFDKLMVNFVKKKQNKQTTKQQQFIGNITLERGHLKNVNV